MEYKFYSSLEPVVEEVEVEEVVEEIAEPTIGIVVDCEKLNVRDYPSLHNGVVICAVDRGSELMIDLDDSNEHWYSVCNSAGLMGYCMKKFVELKE